MRRKIIITLVAIILMLSMTFSTIAASLTEQQREIKEQIRENEDKLEEIEENLSDTMKEIQSLSSSISDYEEEISDLKQKLNNLENEIEEKTEELETSEANHARQYELFQTRLVAMAEAGETTYLDVLLNSADFTDLISNYYLVTEMANLDVELLEQIEAETKKIQETKAELEEKEKEVIEATAEVEKKATALKNKKTQKDSYVAKLSDEEAALQSEIEEYEAELNKVEAAIKEAERQAAANSGSSGGNYVKYTGGTLSWPTRTTKRVNSVYAPGGRTDIPVSGSVHKGIDLYAPHGTPIYAAADGQVVYINASGWGGGFGTYVVLSHGNGLYTLYAHGSGIGNISVGSTVTTDTVIMYSGNTGWSYGAHLHFEVCLGSTSNKVNPAPYLGIENKVGYVQ